MNVGNEIQVFYRGLKDHNWRLHIENGLQIAIIDSNRSRHASGTMGAPLCPEQINRDILSGHKTVCEMAEEADVPEDLIETILREWRGNTCEQ